MCRGWQRGREESSGVWISKSVWLSYLIRGLQWPQKWLNKLDWERVEPGSREGNALPSTFHSSDRLRSNLEVLHSGKDSTCSGHSPPPGQSPAPGILPPASAAASPAGRGGAVHGRPLPRRHRSSGRRSCNVTKTTSWACQPPTIFTRISARSALSPFLTSTTDWTREF